MTVHIGAPPIVTSGDAPPADPARRAVALWPRLDRRALARCAGDPDRIARLVERRTALSHEAIVELLRAPDSRPGDLDRELWFG